MDMDMGMGMATGYIQDADMQMDEPAAATQSIYPHSATLFAAISACVFVTIGVLGE